MIPYFAQPQLHVGPVTIHAFGVLVACALVVGTTILRRRAAAEGLCEREVGRFLSWILVGGFAGAHLLDRLVYFPADTLADPLSLVRFWESLSSFGGFLGGTLGALLFFNRGCGSGRHFVPRVGQRNNCTSNVPEPGRDSSKRLRPSHLRVSRERRARCDRRD